MDIFDIFTYTTSAPYGAIFEFLTINILYIIGNLGHF